MRRWVGWMLFVASASACGRQPPPPCNNAPFWGELAKSPELDLLQRTDEGGYALLSSQGDPIDLKYPVQGGHVLFVGARIRNLHGCRAKLTARMRDPATDQVYSQESRVVDFPEDSGQGGLPLLSDSANVANIPMCPDYDPFDVVDQPWVLEVTVEDKDGRSATARQQVVPRCRQAGPYSRAACRCECRAGYSPQKCANLSLDGG